MGRKGTSRKPSTKSGAGESRAPRSAVASTRKRQSTRPSQPDPAQPPMDDAAARRYGHFVIAVTLIAIAVPVVIAIINIARIIPAVAKPSLFTPWWAPLISLGVIAMTWGLYIPWIRQRRTSDDSST